MAIAAIDHIFATCPRESVQAEVKDLLNRINKHFFEYELSELLMHYAVLERDKFITIHNIIYPRDYSKIHSYIFTSTTSIEIITAVAANIFALKPKSFYGLFPEGRDFYALKILNHLADSPDFEKFLPYWLDILCKYPFKSLTPEARTKFIRFLAPILKNNTDNLLVDTFLLHLSSLNDSKLCLEIIPQLPKKILRKFITALIADESPILLDVIEFSSEVNCLTKLFENYSASFHIKCSGRRMFDFLRNLTRLRREWLYKTPLLRGSLSLKEFIEGLENASHLTSYDGFRLEHVPPFMLVACYIPLQTILKLCPHMTKEQIRFIAYYARKSAVLKIFDKLDMQNLKHLREAFVSALPEKPELHPYQLTLSELKARVKSIRA